MTTQVINIEDTMPYVEPPVVRTPVQIFRAALNDESDVLDEDAAYWRSQKEWAKASLSQKTATEIARIARASDPAKEMEEALTKLSRLYLDLKTAQTNAQADMVRFVRLQNKDRAAEAEASAISSLIRDHVAEHVPSNADVKAQERADDDKALEDELKKARENKNLVELRKQQLAKRKGPLPKARPARRGGTTK